MYSIIIVVYENYYFVDYKVILNLSSNINFAIKVQNTFSGAYEKSYVYRQHFL